MRVITKIGIVLGVGVLTSVARCLVGIALSLIGNMGWIHLGESQPWMPLIGLEYGFPLGIVIGVIVASGMVRVTLKSLITRMPLIQVYTDYACAWIILAIGIVTIVQIEVRHPIQAVLDTPLLWVLLAMLNLVRLRNGYAVKGLKVFCIGANVAVLALEAVRFKMFPGAFSLVIAVPVLAESIFSLARNTRTACELQQRTIDNC